MSKPDLNLPHYRFTWRVQYDSLRGPWVTQLDEAGYERSLGALEWARVVRVELQPRDAQRPTLELRIHPGEQGSKHWTCDIAPGWSEPVVREVLQLIPQGGPVYLIYDAEANRVLMTTHEDDVPVAV